MPDPSIAGTDPADSPEPVPAAQMTPSAAEATTGTKVVRGGLWVAASNILPQIYIVMVSVVAARYLGPDGMGQQSFIAFAQISVVVLFTGGLPVALMRFLSESLGSGRRGAVRTLLRWAWGLEAIGAVAGLLILVLISGSREDLRSAWLAAGIAAALSILHSVPSAALTALQRWRQQSVVGIVTGALSVVATIGVLAAGYGIVGMFVVEAIISLTVLASSTILAQRAVSEIKEEPEPADDIKRKILPYAGWVSIDIVLGFVVWRRSEFFFLEAYSTDAQIAFYSIAFGAVAALLKVTSIASMVAAPAVATLLGAGDRGRIASGFGRASRLTLHLSLPLTALALALGPLLVRLAYGEEYSPAAGPLLLLLIGVPLLSMAGLSTALLAGLGQVKAPLAWTAVATVVNVVAAFLLVRPYGAVGAALADTIAQTVAALPIVILARRRLPGVSFEPGRLMRTVACSILAAVVAQVASVQDGWSGLAAGVVCGGLALMASLALLRPLSHADAVWLANTLQRRGHGGLLSRAVLRCGDPTGARA